MVREKVGKEIAILERPSSEIMTLTAIFLHCAAHESDRGFSLKEGRNESAIISYDKRHSVCNVTWAQKI